MSGLIRLARLRLWSDRAAARAAQYGSYAVAPVVLVLAARALTRFGATEVELLIGLLAACGLAVAMIALGTVTAIHEEIRRR
ncbi:hypothetical protein [Paludisphaera sp.]|uniref:hypothetical protein n=1 Tax=Paludisphaera sp. TaxID=2017432 RepID=UPI00301D679A